MRNISLIYKKIGNFLSILNVLSQLKKVFLIFDLILINNVKFLLENSLNYTLLMITTFEIILIWAFVRNGNSDINENTIFLINKLVYCIILIVIFQSLSMHYLYISNVLPYIYKNLEISKFLLIQPYLTMHLQWL